MEITDKDGMTHEVASNNKGNAALTLGIIGATGVGLGLLGAGVFGIGGKNPQPPVGNVGPNAWEAWKKANDGQFMLQGEMYQYALGTERFNNGRFFQQYKDTVQGDAALQAEISELKTEVAVLKATTPLHLQIESERRRYGLMLENVYVNGTFQPQTIATPALGTDPTVTTKQTQNFIF